MHTLLPFKLPLSKHCKIRYEGIKNSFEVVTEFDRLKVEWLFPRCPSAAWGAAVPASLVPSGCWELTAEECRKVVFRRKVGSKHNGRKQGGPDIALCRCCQWSLPVCTCGGAPCSSAWTRVLGCLLFLAWMGMLLQGIGPWNLLLPFACYSSFWHPFDKRSNSISCTGKFCFALYGFWVISALLFYHCAPLVHIVTAALMGLCISHCYQRLSPVWFNVRNDSVRLNAKICFCFFASFVPFFPPTVCIV